MTPPEVCGTLCVSIARPPKWHAVEHCLPVEVEPYPAEPLVTLRVVNTLVNVMIADKSDGVVDVWQTPASTEGKKAGDCEDKAILKRYYLVGRGIPCEDIFMVVGSIPSMGDHAVLAVNVGGQFYILDSLADEVFPDNAYPDFRPKVSYGLRCAFVHGSPA